jgi:hypothetical protein
MCTSGLPNVKLIPQIVVFFVENANIESRSNNLGDSELKSDYRLFSSNGANERTKLRIISGFPQVQRKVCTIREISSHFNEA